ncbi:MAG: hypothetical protein R2724_34690 [Bryobacterales bacterium]
MSRTLWFLLLSAPVTGCVLDAPWVDDRGGYDDEVSLWADPSTIESGTTAAVRVTDDYANADFRDVWDVRSVGDFEVVEWSQERDALTAVVRLAAQAQGEQVLALDFDAGTRYATFDAW